MASPQRPSPDLANMLPGPRFQQGAEQAPVPQPPQRAPSAMPPPLRLDEHSVSQQREARQERRRMKQASPHEGRNVRQSGTGESDGGLASPIRPRPQGTPPPITTTSPELNPDMARYGLAVDSTDVPSPTARQPRQRLSTPGRQSPEPRSMVTPPVSDQGSELGSPSRRVSRTDLHSSRDSLESVPTGGVFRSNRRGSGFKKANKAASGSGAASKPASKAGVADLHVVGEIVGASGFSFPMLFCRWELVYEPAKSWKVLRGLTKGSTHACCCELDEDELVVWEHPLDIHMQTQSLQGWPSLLLRVHTRDEGTNRDAFVSYAMVRLPTTPGLHHLSCHTWFAVEANRAAGRTFFGWYTGLTPRLEDESFLTSLRQREDAGAFICTVGAGQVHLRLNVLTRNFHQIGHQGGESLAAALERLNTNIQKSVIMEERRRSHDSLTEGQRLVRSGREERIASARAALDSRRRGDLPSPAPSDTSRNPSFMERQGRSSFRGFGGAQTSASLGRQGSELVGGQDVDGRSETSFSSYSRPRDRYAERLARRERDKSAREGGSSAPLVAGGEAGGGGGGGAGPSSDSATAPSRPVSVSGSGAPATRTNSGLTERSASRSGRGGGGPAAAAAASRPADDDDGLETIAADDAVAAGAGGAVGTDDAAGRAAARAARRAQQRSAF